MVERVDEATRASVHSVVSKTSDRIRSFKCDYN